MNILMLTEGRKAFGFGNYNDRAKIGKRIVDRIRQVTVRWKGFQDNYSFTDPISYRHSHWCGDRWNLWRCPTVCENRLRDIKLLRSCLVFSLVVANYVLVFVRWRSFSIVGHYVIPLIGIIMMMFVYESNEHGGGINFRFGYVCDKFLHVSVYEYFSETFFTYFFGVSIGLMFILELLFIFKKRIPGGSGNVLQKRAASE